MSERHCLCCIGACPQRSDDFDAWALALLLRQAARTHLGLSEGDYWPSDVASAQARAVIAAGYVLPPATDQGGTDA